jgi:hypothetical protein
MAGGLTNGHVKANGYVGSATSDGIEAERQASLRGVDVLWLLVSFSSSPIRRR